MKGDSTMNIDQNIQAKADAIHAERLAHQVDPSVPTPISDEVQSKAVNAILGSITDYVDYMRLFAADEVELARLIPTDGTTEPERQLARAYLVRNGVCGSGTGDHLLENVSVTLN
jgi:hypothetical protein